MVFSLKVIIYLSMNLLLLVKLSKLKKKVPVSYDKSENPFLISSSKIMSGTGLMIVAAVGRNSYYGKLKLKIQNNDD